MRHSRESLASKSEASVLHKHESEHHPHAPAEWKMKVYNYHSKPLRRQIEEGVLINNARGGELLNSKSEMTRGGKIPRLVIMVGDKEVHNDCGERRQVEAHTHIESSPVIVTKSVGRKSKMIIPGVKRQSTQPLISDVVKKLRMSENPAKRKQLEDEAAHLEDDWQGEELFSNSITYVVRNKYGNGVTATFGQDQVGQVSLGLCNSNESCEVDISGSCGISQISQISQIVGKDSNLHIAESSEPADILALDYNDPEVSLNCNNTQEVRELFPPCTDYPLPPFVFTGSGKSEEESEEEKKRRKKLKQIKEIMWKRNRTEGENMRNDEITELYHPEGKLEEIENLVRKLEKEKSERIKKKENLEMKERKNQMKWVTQFIEENRQGRKTGGETWRNYET